MAFEDEGKAFAAANAFDGNVLEAVDFLKNRFPFRYRGDPVPSWKQQANKLRAKADPHLALAHYHSFAKQTGPLRIALEKSAMAAEAAIDAEIDRMRGK